MTADRSELQSDQTGTPGPHRNIKHAANFCRHPLAATLRTRPTGGCSTVQGDTLQPEEREHPLTPLNAHSAKHYVSLRPATWAIAQVALGATPHNARYIMSATPQKSLIQKLPTLHNYGQLCDMIF